MKELSNILKFPINTDEIELLPEDRRDPWIAFCQDLGIPQHFRNVDLSQLKGLNDMVKEKIKLWMSSKIQNLILYGPPGCGKTHAALTLLRFFQSRQPWIQYLPSEKMIFLGQEHGTEHLRRLYGEADTLLIDDLGVEKPAEWQTKFLYSIVDERYGNKKRTIITTNIDENSLEAIYTKRTTSRLQAQWAKFNNVDWRETL